MRFPFHFILSIAAAVCVVTSSAQTNTYPWPSNGYVGIGTASPGTFLHVLGDTSSNGVRLVRFESPSTDTGLSLKNTSVGGRTYSLFSSGAGSGLYTGVFSVVDDTSGAARFAIWPSGNVSVGFASSPYKFSVESASNSYSFRMHAAGDAIWAFAGDGSAGTNIDLFSIRNNNSGVVHLNTVNGARLALGVSTGTTAGSIVENVTITSGGNVGVGTTSPSAPLDIKRPHAAAYGTLIPIINLNGYFPGYDENAQRATIDSGVPPVSFGNTTYGWMAFSTRGSDGLKQRLTIYPNGNVGIGTNDPPQKLSVNGTIRAKEVIVETSGWSDYVFADNYSLQSLAEVEQHIKEHKHLPGIPSAQQVAESGIGLGEMQAKLLAKIEELTLHQIEQEKEIRRLNEEVRQIPELQAELAKLRK